MNETPPPQPPPIYTPPEPIAVPPPEPTPPQPKNKKRIIIIIIITVLVLVAIGLFVKFIYIDSSTDTHSDTTNKTPITQNTGTSTINLTSISTAYDDFHSNGVDEFSPADRQATLDTYKKLIEGFDFDAAYARDSLNYLFTLGVAHLASKDPSNFDTYRSEMYELTKYDLKSMPQGIQGNPEDIASDKTNKAAVDAFTKFTDTEAASKLNVAIKNSNLLEDAAQALKLKSTSSLKNVHFVPLKIDSATNPDFAKAHPMNGANPTMWVEEIDGVFYVLMTKSYTTDFLQDPNGREHYRLIHELVHTVSNFSRGDMGRIVEERRAETLSGDKSAYYDVKQLFIYTKVFANIDLLNILQSNPTNPQDFWLHIYKTLGVRTANKLLVAMPSGFYDYDSVEPPLRDTLNLYDNKDGFIIDMIKLGKNDTKSMDQRMDERIKLLKSVFKTRQGVIDDLNNNLGSVYGMPSAAREMIARVNNTSF